jgi:hypothetical protein
MARLGGDLERQQRNQRQEQNEEASSHRTILRRVGVRVIRGG